MSVSKIATLDNILSLNNHLFIAVGIIAIVPLLIISFINLDNKNN